MNYDPYYFCSIFRLNYYFSFVAVDLCADRPQPQDFLFFGGSLRMARPPKMKDTSLGPWQKVFFCASWCWLAAGDVDVSPIPELHSMATYDALSWEFNRIFNVLIPKHTTKIPEFNFHIQSVPCPMRQKIIACEKDLKITRRQPGKSHLHTYLYQDSR